jgi:sugar lactone lactonase YvrE
LCDKKQGPCLGKVKSCGGEKGWLACSIKEYGADYENNETKCDKIDNDCDGKVDEGCVITIAGTGVDGFQDGSALQAQFTAPFGLAFDGSGSLYISDQKNHRIRILDSLGIVSTFAGTGKPGFLDAAVQYCQFDNPRGLTFDSKGNLYVTDAYNNRIRKIDVQGKVTTFAGSGQSGQTNGPALSASLYLPHFIAFSSGGDVFFTEASTHWIRKISSGGSVSVLAGVASDFGFRDGSRTQSRFGFPYGIVADKSGDLYVADASNSRIRKVDSNGNVTTFAGSGKRGNKDGPALSAEFSFPSSIVIDPKGNFYFVDLDNHQIKKIDTKGMVTTVAGVGSQGFRDGPSEKAMFRAPTSLVIGPDGSLYVTDTGNHRIRKIILP